MLPKDNNYFERLKDELVEIMKTEFDFSEFTFSVPGFLAKLTKKAKESDTARNLLRQKLAQNAGHLLDALNNEILKPGIKELKKKQKKGLVVIVDNLEKVTRSKGQSKDKSKAEELFVYNAHYLKLQCHTVYTTPLSLQLFNSNNLTNNFRSVKRLPMVSVKSQKGEDCEKGLKKLKQMIIARAFPTENKESLHEREHLIHQIFDNTDTLEELCRISGGHVRNLLRYFLDCMDHALELPLTKEHLEMVIQAAAQDLERTVKEEQWSLIKEVSMKHSAPNEVSNHENLLDNLLIFEYYDSDTKKQWFGVNPLLEKLEKFKDFSE
jgi:hypothetical protein